MYAKIFTSIFDGSMRGHSDLILVFVNMLCHADQDGIVDRHWRAIADETGLSHDQVRSAVAALEGPDVESRSRNDDGRRIRRIDPEREWGWKIVNFTHYRQLRSAEERREYLREYMRKKRKSLTSVNNCKQCQPIAEAEADTEAVVGSTPHPPVENKTPPKTGKEPKNNPTLSDLAAQVQSCRPEFARLNTDSILNLLRNVPLPIARRAVAEFCRDEINALKVPDQPLKLLGGYIRTARTAPQFTGAHNVSYDVQRQNDIRLARQEYEAMKNPYGRTPDQAKTEQARIVSAIAAKYGPAAAAAVRQTQEGGV